MAGRRAGLVGERSGLFYELARIIGELAPAWVLLENVPGLLSSNGGRDMGAVLGTLGELGYGYAYRVLDSQYFGVPQRRERVFIVGRAGGICPAEVLFEPESLPWNSPPSRETGARVAASLTRGAEKGGRGGYAGRRQEDDVNIALCLNAKGGSGRSDGESETFIARPLKAGGNLRHDESHDTIIAAQCHGSNVGPMGTLRAGNGNETGGVPFIAATLNSGGNHGGFRSEPGEHLIAHTLRAEGHDASEDGTGRGTPIIPFDTTQITSAQNRSQPKEGDPMHPLSSGAHPPAIAFNATQDPISGEIEGALSHQCAATAGRFGVRRLTPVECERLQDFPDGWTQWGKDERGVVVNLKDSPRYRMLGNAVTVSVVEWLVRRIVEASK